MREKKYSEKDIKSIVDNICIDPFGRLSIFAWGWEKALADSDMAVYIMKKIENINASIREVKAKNQEECYEGQLSDLYNTNIDLNEEITILRKLTESLSSDKRILIDLIDEKTAEIMLLKEQLRGKKK